jgi:hypothetical protein
MTPVEALQAARQLLGCFRQGDANDPEMYGTAIASILSLYTPEVVQFVCDPRTGLPGRMNWMPSVAEVKAACDAHAGELSKTERFQHWGERQLLANEHDAQERKLEAPKPTLDELHARYGTTWGLAPESLKPIENGGGMKLDKVIEHYRTHGLQFKPKPGPAATEGLTSNSDPEG